MQNSAAGLVTVSRKCDHITPILRRLHWLPVRCRIIFQILLLTCKHQPTSKICLSIRTRAVYYGIQTSICYDEPVANLKTYGDRAYSAVTAPKLWNKLPSGIRLLSPVTIFKTKLKIYLFTKSFDL